MIEYCYEIDYKLDNESQISEWIVRVIESEDKTIHGIVYIFCDDDRLLDLNRQYLDHDTYTDILTFPYGETEGIHADIFISIPRVQENAKQLEIDEQEELRRVMIHGVLHLLGNEDYTQEEKTIMRELEDEKLRMFHVEQ